jgi:hypothetical protein
MRQEYINVLDLLGNYTREEIIQAAIDIAVLNNKCVYVPGGIYEISNTVIVKDSVKIYLDNAIIKPTSNIDVVQIKPNAKIIGLTVDCSAIEGWNKTAILIYGGDVFRGYDRCFLKNITLINTITGDGTLHLGNGIKMYCDVLGQAIEFINFENIYTQGFGKGIYIYSTIATNYTNSPWINANNFTGYQSFKDTSAIYIDCKYQAEGNIFSNFQIQGDYYGSSDYGIYVKSSRNKFHGAIYDWGASFQSETAIYIESGSINNSFDLVNQTIYDVKNIIIDNGARTVFETNSTKSLNANLSLTCDKYGMNGIQDNFLSYADKKFSCSLTGTPTYGGLSRIFDPNNYLLTPFSEQTVIIEIDMGSEYMTKCLHIGIQFVYGYFAENIKCEIARISESYQTIYDKTANNSNLILINLGIDTDNAITNINKIKITFSGVVDTNMTLEKIFAIDSYKIGNTWLSKNGGNLYNDVEFDQNKSIVVWTPNGNDQYRIGVDNAGNITTTLI